MEDINRQSKMMWNFIYSDRKINLRQDLGYAPLAGGGMAIPNLRLLFHTQRIDRIYRYFKEMTGLWQQMMHAWLQSARSRISKRGLPWLPFSQTTDKQYLSPSPWTAMLNSWKPFSGRIAEPSNPSSNSLRDNRIDYVLERIVLTLDY